MFDLHPVLKADTVDVAKLKLCRALLMRDKTYPWLVLVPEREGLRDFDDLSPADRALVGDDIDRAAKAMKSLFKPYKLNVAALGNMVEQLHIHVIARFQGDPAWPAPVWGKHPAQDYDDDARADIVARIKAALEAV